MINDKGRSMVEMLGVLAIIGVLSAGALAGYSKAMFQHKMNQTIDAFNGILQRVMELDQQEWKNGTYIGYEYNKNAEDIVSYGLLPNCSKTQGEFWNDDFGCRLPIGVFQMTLGGHSIGVMGGDLLLSLYDSKSCIAFLSAHWENATPIDFWSTTYSNAAGIQVCPNDSCNDTWLYHPSEGKMTYNMDDIARSCQICDEQGSCSIFFIIRYEW